MKVDLSVSEMVRNSPDLVKKWAKNEQWNLAGNKTYRVQYEAKSATKKVGQK